MQFVPFDLSRHFNVDIIANPGDENGDSMDGGSCMLTVDGFDGTRSNNPNVQGLPEDGIVGVHRLANYTDHNAIQVLPGSPNIHLEVPPDVYHQVRFLVVGTFGDSDLPVLFRYRTGAPEESTVLIEDWFNDDPSITSHDHGRGISPDVRQGVFPAINGMDRLCGGALHDCNDPALFEYVVHLDGAKELVALQLECERRRTSLKKTRTYVLRVTGVRFNK